MSEPSLLRQLPPVHELMRAPEISLLMESYSRELVLDTTRELLEEVRGLIRAGHLNSQDLNRLMENLGQQIESRIQKRLSPSLRSVINATGVVIYTNAGRAPLSDLVLRSVSQVSSSYSNLEYDLNSGKRGHRDLHFEAGMMRLLPCQAATVVNNTAAALFLILNTLAEDREVLVSRGELIEIGGSFRLPSIMQKSGALLKEVGTTNKTKPQDYLEAISESTALILRVHPSNYRVVGFTQRPTLSELVEVAHRAKLPLVHDLGSGLLFPTGHAFLQNEPTAENSLSLGADLVCFSGDKLLGGPQAGLILGKAKMVSAIRKNPLMRACRVDKMTYAGLEATLREYEKGTYRSTLPLWQLMEASPETIQERTRSLARRLETLGFQVEIAPGFSLTGGGSAPEEKIPTFLLKLRSQTRSVNWLENALRKSSTAVLTRIEDDALVVDLRTVFPRQDQEIAAMFEEIAVEGI